MGRLLGLDAKDRQILALLETDARRSNSEIARLAGISPPTVTERIGRLFDIGVIKGFTVKVDAGKVGLPTSALIKFRRTAIRDDKPGALLAQPAVRACYRLEGSETFLILVCVADIAALNGLLDQFARYGETETSLILCKELEEQPLFSSSSFGEGGQRLAP